MTAEFVVALRGYDRPRVDEILSRADEALASDSESERAAARTVLEEPDIVVVLRGYDMEAVDAAIAERLRLLNGGAVLDLPPAPPEPPATPGQRFTVVLRGFDRAEVDAVLTRADEAVASDSEFARAAARDTLSGASFPIVWRGYDRGQVDRAVRNRLARLT